MSHVPGKWISYTPTWSATGGTPSVGNGTLTGKYTRVGNLVTARIQLLWGSTTTANSGTLWNFTLPVPALTGGLQAGSAAWRGTYYGGGYVALEGTTAIHPLYGGGTAASEFVGYNAPFTWADTHWLAMQITYEAA